MSALDTARHVWRAGATGLTWGERDECDPREGRLLVADSWRVVDGRVRGLEKHRARFLASAAEHRDDAEAFWRDAIAVIPRSGDWFPRVEVRDRADGSQLNLLLRQTPAISTEVDVATAPYDPRTRPLVKGPDLDALQALRGAVQLSGAGEAVILDDRGHIVEGAYSGLLWWRGEVLVRASGAVPRIPSVTIDLVLEAARAAGVTIDEADAQPADLAGCELWVLSALHGLRVATRWINGPTLAAGHRASLGRVWLSAAEATINEQLAE